MYPRSRKGSKTSLVHDDGNNDAVFSRRFPHSDSDSGDFGLRVAISRLSPLGMGQSGPGLSSLGDISSLSSQPEHQQHNELHSSILPLPLRRVQ